MHPSVALALDLLARPSVTPDDAGCHHALAEVLRPAGFKLEEMPFGDVSNLWATHGTGGPLIVFAGHCDVVPPGPREAWKEDPFFPSIENGVITARGAADMKSGLAAMTTAVAEFVKAHPDHAGTIALLSTSDEEGAGLDGTKAVLEALVARGEKPDFAFVGEPTSETQFGDTIKVGRRGSISGYLTVRGIQGHVAYPHLARNPIHDLAPFLVALTRHRWDEGDEVFPPTSLQVANLNAGTGAINVIPGVAHLEFNVRFGPATTGDEVRRVISQVIEEHGLDAEVRWLESAQAFKTESPVLIDSLIRSIESVTGIHPTPGTSGGTSDARFFAAHGIPVVEFGPINATIHAANECVTIQEIEQMHEVLVLFLRYLASADER